MQALSSVAGRGSRDALSLRPSFCPCVRLSASSCVCRSVFLHVLLSLRVPSGLSLALSPGDLERPHSGPCGSGRSWKRPRAPQPSAHPGRPATSRPTHAGSPPLTQGAPDRAPESPLEVGLATVSAPLCRPAGDWGCLCALPRAVGGQARHGREGLLLKANIPALPQTAR